MQQCVYRERTLSSRSLPERSLVLRRPLILLRHVLWTSRTVVFRSAVGAEAGPGEEQILNLTTRLWEGPPRGFFAAEHFQRQECVSQHDQRRVVLPAGPASPLVMIEPQFLLQLLIVLLDLVILADEGCCGSQRARSGDRPIVPPRVGVRERRLRGEARLQPQVIDDRATRKP